MKRSEPPAGHTALLQAARLEFAERGYEGTSIRQIAQRAGMSLSVLYHYYPGKMELLQAIVNEALDTYFDACAVALADTGDDPVKQLTALVTATIGFRTANPARSTVMVDEERSFDPDFLRVYRERRAKGSRLFHEVIAAGRASGVFHTPFPEDARRAVIAMCNAVGEWYDPSGPDPVDEIARRYVQLALVIVEFRDAGERNQT